MPKRKISKARVIFCRKCEKTFPLGKHCIRPENFCCASCQAIINNNLLLQTTDIRRLLEEQAAVNVILQRQIDELKNGQPQVDKIVAEIIATTRWPVCPFCQRKMWIIKSSGAFVCCWGECGHRLEIEKYEAYLEMKDLDNHPERF